MDEKLSIKVHVAERFYPLKIDRNDEEKIRKAARMINEKVNQYKEKYTDKDTSDFLAMAALQFVIRLLEMEQLQEDKPIIDSINQLNEKIKEAIK
jgi:cell division protein ZapA (FtsZ GTPase activity inhibitor)